MRRLALLLLLALLCVLVGCGGDDCGPTSDWPHCSTPTKSDSANDDDDDEEAAEEPNRGGGSTKKDAGAASGSKPARDAGRTLLDAAGLTDDSGLTQQTCAPSAVDAGMPDGGAEETSADGGCEPDH